MDGLGHWGFTELEVARLLDHTGGMGNPCQICLQLAELMHAQSQNSELKDGLLAHAPGCANGRLLLTYYYGEPPKMPESNA